MAANFIDAGEQSLKNMAKPVRVYRVELDQPIRSRPTRPASALPEKPSIAVLPFDNISGDLDQEFFADGLAEDIITTLSKLAGLRVIARNSSFVYKRRAVDVRELPRTARTSGNLTTAQSKSNGFNLARTSSSTVAEALHMNCDPRCSQEALRN